MLDRMLLSAGGEDKLFVEDVFSTYLYTGNGSTQTITNGIDLAGKGGMVWVKDRTSAYQARIVDTVRGATNGLIPSATNSTVVDNSITALNSNGFTVGNVLNSNGSGDNYASWTFRKAPKFFDVVTYTGNGVSTGRNISHALGVRPGFIIVKRTDSTSDWAVLATDPVTGFYHGGVTSTPFALNLTNAKTWSGGGSAASATTFNACHVQLDDTTNFSADFNVNGATYVAYLYAHDATADGVIQCGAATVGADGNAYVTTGWEPQWLLFKKTNGTGDWIITDTMRGLTTLGQPDNILRPNLANAEVGGGLFASPNATGFSLDGWTNGNTFIYIAIRRPMKTPTLGTSVFAPVLSTNTGSATTVTTNFPVDLTIFRPRNISDGGLSLTIDRLRGGTRTNGRWLGTSSTGAESNYPSYGVGLDSNVSLIDNLSQQIGYVDLPEVFWNFRRAPSFFDEVCYTGTQVNRTVNHSLGVVPELVITKARNWSLPSWFVGSLFGATNFNLGYLNQTTIYGLQSYSTSDQLTQAPTSTQLFLGQNGDVNGSGFNYVAYLFASCPGVSKVGSYTGNGSSQTINCGFSNGARFILIKRTDSTGDWYVWDTARGIVAGNDPHLSLNTTAAEVTSNDTIDPDSSGFTVNQVAATNVNVNAATYIYLAIA